MSTQDALSSPLEPAQTEPSARWVTWHLLLLLLPTTYPYTVSYWLEHRELLQHSAPCPLPWEGSRNPAAIWLGFHSGNGHESRERSHHACRQACNQRRRRKVRDPFRFRSLLRSSYPS